MENDSICLHSVWRRSRTSRVKTFTSSPSRQQGGVLLQAPGWPAHSGVATPQQSPAPVPQAPNKTQPKQSRAQSAATDGEADGGVGDAMRACIKAAAEAVAAAAGELDDMDSRVGDGDCGATLGLAAAAILQVGAVARPRTHAHM